MLAGPKFKIFTDHINSFSKEELVWANGYIAGLIGEVTKVQLVSATNDVANKKLTIAYGTETGNSKKLAIDFAAKAKKNGVHAKLVSLDQYRLADLVKEEYFITVISTQGEGEPPIAAQKFYDHIHKNGFKIPSMKYAVLALGDTSYPMFCKTGEDVDLQLQNIGASRIAPLKKCDLDYEEPADEWFNELLQSLNNTAIQPITTALLGKDTATVKKTPGKKIYTGKVLANINLNASGSHKKTFHIELSANDVEYLPGDSIGIVPENDQLVVEEIIALSGIDAHKIITYKNEENSIKELLTKKINVSYLLEKYIKQYAVLVEQEIPDLREDLIQLIRKYPVQSATRFETFLLSLNPIAPRIYNIASSINAHGTEVHIIALKDEFEREGKKQIGLCSAFLENKKEGDEISFFVQPNKRFRLPAKDADIIMIGQGTGIAPFRSFLAERDAIGATGRNWLFFGEEQFTTDFYYQTEWQNWFGTDVLTKINLAFSDSQEEKIYIQHKILLQSATLFEWINNGAFVFLCGEKEVMSKEVESALLTVIENEGKLSKEEAVKYFDQLRTDGRYMKDVY